MHDTQLPPPSPPHSTFTPAEAIKIKDVTNTTSQNVNPLTTEDLTKILDQSTQLAQLCSSFIFFSVDELHKLVEKLKEVKVSSQDPPKTIQTTRILLLPPPSPPRAVTQALQELSAATEADIGISVQIVSTPPTTMTQDIRSHDMTRYNQLRGSHKVYCG